MSETEIFYQTNRALILVLLLSMPAIIAATVVGTLVSLLQALTQIQEQTLSYAFKLTAVAITLMLTIRWVGLELFQYTITLLDMLPEIG